MNKKQYETKRNELMTEAQNLINEGKVQEANDKMEEVKELDEKWDSIAQAEANFNALNKEPVPLVKVDKEKIGGNGKEAEEPEAVQMWKSEDYKAAWAKILMNVKLTNEEEKIFKMVNEAFSHNTQNTGIVIPNTVAKGIWEMAGELYPYFEDVTKTSVNGTLSIIQEDTSSEAAWYEEDTATEDGKETFKEIKLTGCELSRSVNISWKLREMAIEDFIPYIQRKMAKKMGEAAGYGAIYGAGATAESGKPEPMGTITALKGEKDTPQVVTYPNGSKPGYKDIVATRAKIKSGYGAGLCIYANNETIWNSIAGIVDVNGRPIFVPDPTGIGQFRVLGMQVKEDASMKDGDILMSNPGAGYHMNINREISLMTEEHVKERNTDYCGYAIMDGNVTTNKAHALLTEAAKVVG